jgi:hypothetical protein
MQPFDEIVAVDWSASGTPKTGPDSIWIAATTGEMSNPATRDAAKQGLRDRIRRAISLNRRTLVLFDFALGAPAGLAGRATGSARAPALWDWLAQRHEDDARNRTNYRLLAAELNGLFNGEGPFWGNGQKADIPGLPRRKPPLPDGITAHRRAEIIGHERGLVPKPIWQLAGAGAVGAQSLTGMAMIAELWREHAPKVVVWPFEPAETAPVVLAETYLSLLPGETLRRAGRGMVKDAAQASSIADGFLRLDRRGDLTRLFQPAAPPDLLAEEGWYLGAGQAALVQSAFD